MKKILYLALALSLGACHQKPPEKTTTVTSNGKGMPAMAFTELNHDFGEVVQGEKVEYDFKFTNTGDRDLIITDATSTCGCTVPDWPREPIRPNTSAYMKVVFNSAGKEGFQEKQITVRANTNPETVEGPKIQCNVVVKQ
jgi:hypothetical protein